MNLRGGVFILVIAATLASLNVGWRAFVVAGSGEEVTITVEPGESMRAAVERLAEAGAVPSTRGLWMYARIFRRGATVAAGEHTVIVGDRYADLITNLASAQDSTVSVTFPEGFTVEQMGARLAKELNIPAEDWAAASAGKEGYLFPDTYRLPKNATAQDVVQKMESTLQNRLAALGAPTGRAAQYSTAELITLASIIEREVRNKDDMRNVADIFLKRLEMGMALQSDATVNYILDTGLSGVSIAHTKVDNPYNTYQYPGLPPGPISNPGMNALDAAFHPTDNLYYYFLTDNAGAIYYGRTFDEHIANRRKAGI